MKDKIARSLWYSGRFYGTIVLICGEIVPAYMMVCGALSPLDVACL
jgi:hypothetical protein